jgi:hypothetical protein
LKNNHSLDVSNFMKNSYWENISFIFWIISASMAISLVVYLFQVFSIQREELLRQHATIEQLQLRLSKAEKPLPYGKINASWYPTSLGLSGLTVSFDFSRKFEPKPSNTRKEYILQDRKNLDEIIKIVFFERDPSTPTPQSWLEKYQPKTELNQFSKEEIVLSNSFKDALSNTNFNTRVIVIMTPFGVFVLERSPGVDIQDVDLILQSMELNPKES